jgi:uncharacterized protein YjgD (DUF1641 family)
MYKNLVHDDLPVRLSAAVALSQLLKNTTAQEFLKPALKNILELFLKIIAEIDSEKLVSALEDIMTIYRDHIGPYAV